MKKLRHSENEVIKAVNLFDGVISADITCREYGISHGTLYNWRSEYSGMDSSHIKRLKELEEENDNLSKDLNKGISSISYNSLNLPISLSISNSSGTAMNNYTYSSDGRKLKVEMKYGANQTKTTDYVGNVIYENGVLQRILFDGGYMENYKYYYYIEAIGNATETYKLTGPSASGGTHGVVKGADGVIKIEGSNRGFHIHEIRHVGQSIEAGGVKFNKDGRLLNATTTLEGARNNEIKAYQTQYSFDGSYLAGASSLKDINGVTLMNIKTSDGRTVYEMLKDKKK